MVVDNFAFVGVLPGPAKADAPLIVDADAVLASANSLEGFQAVAERQAHDVESVGGIELEEFSPGGALNVGWKVTRCGAGKEPSGLGVGEAFDHGTRPGRSEARRKWK